MRTAKLRKAAEAETKKTDTVTDYYMPDWYRDPLTKPPAMKGGVSVFHMMGKEWPTFYCLKLFIFHELVVDMGVQWLVYILLPLS